MDVDSKVAITLRAHQALVIYRFLDAACKNQPHLPPSVAEMHDLLGNELGVIWE